MDNKLVISRYSSLNFSEWKHDFERQEEYKQIFASADIIRVQYSIIEDINIILTLYSTESITVISPELIRSDNSINYYEFVLNNLPPDCYRLEISRDFSGFKRTVSYCEFKVLEADELNNTVQLKYANATDRMDVLFYDENGAIKYFDFRVEGGFLYGENVYQADTENFRDQLFSLHNLSSFPFESNTLTIGKATGVPDWVGKKANIIFSCREVYVNGFSVQRAEGSETEREEILEKYPLYVFKIEVEPSDFYNDYLDVTSDLTNIVLGTEDNRIVITEDSQNAIKIF